jgi:hypothetical protein
MKRIECRANDYFHQRIITILELAGWQKREEREMETHKT